MTVAALLADLRIAFMNLIEHGRRTAFLGAAIAAVTSLFVLLTSLSLGIRHTMIDTATTLATGHINVSGYFKVTSGQAAAIVSDYKTVAELVRRSLPEMDFLVQRGRGWGKVVSDNGSSIPAGIGGVDIASEPQFKRVLEILSGNIDELGRPNTVLLFEEQAQKLDVRVGDAVTITGATARGVANTIDCRVVAIAREAGILSGFAVFISNDSWRQFYRWRSDATGMLQIHLKPGYIDDLDPLVERLRAALARGGYRVMEPDPQLYIAKLQTITREEWTGQKLDVTIWEDELSFMMWPLQALQGFSLVLLLILLTIMVAGIMNTLWIAIRERTREIGTLRAIGMQRMSVARLFLLEAALLGMVGATAGVAIGALVTGLINAANLPVPATVQLFLMRSTLHLALEPSTLLTAILMITLVTSAAALYPSLRAARRKPVDAMAHFG